jgi:hypothetical protein
LRETCGLDEGRDRERPITQSLEQREAGHIRKAAKELGLDGCRVRDLSHHLFFSFISVVANMIAIGDGNIKLRMVYIRARLFLPTRTAYRFQASYNEAPSLSWSVSEI